MGFLQKYQAYARDNPHRYWFKRKVYGWGWTPVRLEGWLVLCVFVVLVLAFGLTIDERSSPREGLFTFVLPVVLLTVTLIRICYAKGEKPKWQWGFPKEGGE